MSQNAAQFPATAHNYVPFQRVIGQSPKETCEHAKTCHHTVEITYMIDSQHRKLIQNEPSLESIWHQYGSGVQRTARAYIRVHYDGVVWYRL